VVARITAWQQQLVERGPQLWWEYPLFALLVVLSLLYGGVLFLRERAYLGGFMRRYRAKVPILSVGNLVIGGTGKTPVTDLLVKQLLAHGHVPAVVSRGYGRDGSSALEVVSSCSGPMVSPRVAGDEPYLLARRNPQAIVVVAARRAAGIERAVALGAEVVVLDDGFQHLAVVRDFDLVLLDAQAPLGNGLTLPAGRLREFPAALRRASMYLLTRCETPPAQQQLKGKPLLASQHRLAEAGWERSGTLWPLEGFAGKKVAAFCGIAAPESFFSALVACGVSPRRTLAFEDHVCYDRATVEKLVDLATEMDVLLTTEKDAVKLLEVELPCPCVAVPMELQLHAGDGERFDRWVQRFLPPKEGQTMALAQQLLDILACPACKGNVSYEQDREQIVCTACRLAYPVRDEIPVMLIDEATPLDKA